MCGAAGGPNRSPLILQTIPLLTHKKQVARMTDQEIAAVLAERTMERYAELREKFGPYQAAVAAELGPETVKRAIDSAGDRWMDVLPLAGNRLLREFGFQKY